MASGQEIVGFTVFIVGLIIVFCAVVYLIIWGK
mgnify:CR=1 FL=1